MTPQQFIAKWKLTTLSERSACQQHFLDLCELLGQPKPAEADPDGAWYTFERGVRKSTGGKGWADVWMRDHFGWEYKGKHKDLGAAYNQLLQYKDDLENPPLLIVCDMDRFEVHTNFTGTVKVVHAFGLDAVADPENLDVLRNVFTDPYALKPGQTAEAVTQQAAELIGQLADGMRSRNVPAPRAAHFLMKLMFCMFAEDIDLLPGDVFSRIMETATKPGGAQHLSQLLRSLFEAMCAGGLFGTDSILHFDGGLFADAEVIDLTPNEALKLRDVARLDWSALEPSIFGTLFERTLDPAKRSQIGAHYTSRDDVVTLLEPVVMQPLRREWAEVQAKCEKLTAEIAKVKTATKRKKVRQRGRLLQDFVERLAHVTVLDPACGSGNFLYVALHLLLDLEKEVITYAARNGLGLLPHVRPTQLAGIEINAYAQELASVVIWIGYLQWMRQNGFNPSKDPVLEPIESIRRMDAILDLSDPENPKEPEWPEAEFIVGNPPFLGSRRLRMQLGNAYVDSLFHVFAGRVPRSADLCCYWFEKAREALVAAKYHRVGLLATQSIRGGASRKVLHRIWHDGNIFFGVSDRNWILDGAMVHVSMVGFDDGTEKEFLLDGRRTSLRINPNLTVGTDLTRSQRLIGDLNKKKSFQGITPMGPFVLEWAEGLRLLGKECNPNGRPNSDVLRRWANGLDLIEGRPEDWVIDFGAQTTMEDASKYEEPFEHTRTEVLKARREGQTPEAIDIFWRHWRPRPNMRRALASLKSDRYLVTPRVGKHRHFIWVGIDWLPSDATVAFAFADDYAFGVLHSIVHERWVSAPGMGTQVRERESGFRYTPTTCFETFPFPDPTDTQREAIASVAKELDELRNNWLNPPEWTRTEVLEFPGSADGPWRRYVDPTTVDDRGIGTVRYPRVVPQDEECAKQLKKRTLTNLYNQRPTWLDLAHQKLDAAVFAAYGWEPSLTDHELLAALLALNLERSRNS